jgi:nitrogen PTS system EIIA component
MPHEEMNEQQVASYLNMDARDVARLAQQGRMPGRRVGGKLRFLKSDVDHWVELQMPTLGRERLAEIERGVSEHHGFDGDELLVWRMIPPGGIIAPMGGRTKTGILRELADRADSLGLLYARDEMVEELRRREELCSTAIMPRTAIPHPRHPLPYDIADSFIIVGLSSTGIPFGAEDGSLTSLFFMVCCKDDRTHLHVLARLAQMLVAKNAIARLLEAPDPAALAEILLKLEQDALEAAAGHG